ncbi:glycosyl hydrolases family 18-domain-containing protein [Aspergillus cavernicola]|uniref:chitinase n=1 Tax=Aspergillus cavernicola TaxID=176166 RepID=A0ABR4I145_9EURO
MQTWGFDGVDLDWEYPGADDRGGSSADTVNFAKLLQDMKKDFQGEYGISVTLPASYWYLRWFDLQGMQKNVDFLNIMTYDIHGVWDSSNKHTGPYVRPHTNITEIKQGLDLLWRNDVDPSLVNLGLGWYGRSFTLKDPSCNKPDSDCIFSYGGKAGECTKSSGTLSNSEIQRIIANNNLTPTLDREAAVKWITWGTDQWASYDDGETIQMKMAEANNYASGQLMVFLLVMQRCSGIRRNQERAATIANSCYWTFCGGQCIQGYTSHAHAKGQVPNINGDVSCTDNTVSTLCCAPGTTIGTCSWHGWNGVGMPCSTDYCPSGTEMVAMNTNSYMEDMELQQNSNLTCNGGAQLYCCSGFEPSQIANTDSLSLLGDYRISDDGQTELSEKASVAENVIGGLACVLAGLAIFAGEVTKTEAIVQSFVGVILVARCAKMFAGGPDEGTHAHSFQDDGAAGIGMQRPKSSKPADQGTPKKAKNKFGRYTQARYGKNIKNCETTYTCEYGLGFDEICDNMRWAIEKGFGGNQVYNRQLGAENKPTYQENWRNERGEEYRKEAMRPPGWEEFPFASLKESAGGAYQVVRFVNEVVNSGHSRDWGFWLRAEWAPCSRLREEQGIVPPEPPITMTWSFEEDDKRLKANTLIPHFVEAYGFNSQGDVECFPTYSYDAADGRMVTTTLTDYGFRALPDDPLFSYPYEYPFNNFKRPPTADNPVDIYDINWLKVKRDIALGVLNQTLPLSAIEEAKRAADFAAGGDSIHLAEPTATDAADFTFPMQTDKAGHSWQASREHMPAETGHQVLDTEEEEENDSRMMRRRKQHLQDHQRGYGHGHGHGHQYPR